MTAPGPRLMVGCGVLGREVRWLAERNGWPLELRLLDPMLHVDLPRLAQGLVTELERAKGQDACVFYGACHPSMDKWLARAGRQRTAGVNCLEMLLGPERYQRELAAGAFFLLEAWMGQWREALERTFGDRPWLVREIFQGSHTRLVALRTPCTPEYRAAAEEAAAFVGLPLEWADVDLAHLEAVLTPLLAPRRPGG